MNLFKKKKKNKDDDPEACCVECKACGYHEDDCSQYDEDD